MGPSWYIPKQQHRGRDVTTTLLGGTNQVVASPGADDLFAPTRIASSRTKSVCRAVVVAGQHPGEDAAIRVAVDMIDRFRRQSIDDLDVTIIPLLNACGRQAGHTRETQSGLDLNRSWHLINAHEAADKWRSLLCAADLVLDLHGDESADRPYIVAPSPLPATLRSAIDTLWWAFERRMPQHMRRPRPPGSGEDHPGILINWLAGRGVPGIMLEIPMRLAKSQRSASFRAVRARERSIAQAAVASVLDTIDHLRQGENLP